MIWDLKVVLKEEVNIVKDLLDLLEKQHSYLVNQEVFNLDGIIPKIEDVSKMLAKEETKRRVLTENRNMSSIILEFKEDEELNSLYNCLLTLLEEIKTQKFSNDLIIKQTLSYTNSMLNMLKPRNENNTYNGYGKFKK
ncbi:flagellar protein FlgN [Clostridium sp. UBA4548]|uniref:flagellar protein FlgN n=1 Tax=Clostridium sp. UBA4548 TaxID=1946361 RepID=UPI0025C11731|nr:flagellar protein FlgN [Clostridium sp. UBA4548]